MADRYLNPQQWPISLPPAHRRLLLGIVEKLSPCPELRGLAAGGSFAQGLMDQYSDLDLKVVVDPQQAAAVMGTDRSLEPRSPWRLSPGIYGNMPLRWCRLQSH